MGALSAGGRCRLVVRLAVFGAERRWHDQIYTDCSRAESDGPATQTFITAHTDDDIKLRDRIFSAA